MKLRNIILFVMLTGLVVWISQLPATGTWQKINEYVSVDPKLSVDNIQGVIWGGQADISYDRYTVGQLIFDIQAVKLLLARLQGEWLLTAPTHELGGGGQLTLSEAKIYNVSGYLDNELLNAVSQDYGIDLPGRLSIETLELSIDLTQDSDALPYVSQADGRLNWSGGSVIYKVGRLKQRLSLPPLTATISDRDGGLLMVVEQLDQPGVLVTLLLRQDGFSNIQIRARLAQLTQFAYAPGLDPDEVLLEIKEKLL